MAEYPLDMLIKEIEYNPRLRQYLMAKKAQAKIKKLGDDVQFPAPGGFVVNPDYEAYKRRVDRHNLEARKGNEDYKKRYDEAVRDSIAYAGWEQAHKKEIDAGYRLEHIDQMMRDEKRMLLEEAMAQRINSEPSRKDLIPLNPSVSNEFFTIVGWPGNKDLVDEYANLTSKPFSYYATKNPYKPSYPSEVLNEGKDIPVGNMVPSPQDYIYRYHTTKASNLPYIFDSGLDPRKGGYGYGKRALRLRSKDLKDVYTITRSPEMDPTMTYYPDEGEATIRLKIPKKDYLRMERREENPELDVDYRTSPKFGLYNSPRYYISNADKQLTSVQHGGRTDIFRHKVPSKYIDGVYVNSEWTDPWSFMEDYDCVWNDNCDEWNKALERFRDDEGGLDYGKMRELMKKMGREGY